MTEDQARAALAAFDGLGGLERWIADESWLVAPGGRVVPEPLQGWRFRVERAACGLRVVTTVRGDAPANPGQSR